jgi:hypothetical protein
MQNQRNSQVDYSFFQKTVSLDEEFPLAMMSYTTKEGPLSILHVVRHTLTDSPDEACKTSTANHG